MEKERSDWHSVLKDAAKFGQPVTVIGKLIVSKVRKIIGNDGR